MRRQEILVKLAVAAIICVFFCVSAPAHGTSLRASPDSKFEISFSSSVRNTPITGRLLLVITRNNDVEPRLQAGDWDNVVVPLFGIDVNQLRPGVPAVIDSNTPGFPLRHLGDLPAGDYYVQAILNVYTECHRSDGHDLWMHLDQWEGQHFNTSPGNLISGVQRVYLDPRSGFDVLLVLSKISPPIQPPSDTDWVKHIKFRSSLLSKFWGCPIYLGATVLLPKGYAQHPAVHYPVV
ncbi:MAG: hypothetical protein ACREDR_24270, partial [Blastocatellia bacterium]